MEVLIVVIAIIIVIHWAATGLQKAGAWLCNTGRTLTEMSVRCKQTASKTTKRGADDVYLQKVREEIRFLTHQG